MGPELPTLTVAYVLPERILLEERIMDLADLLVKELVFPFGEENGEIKARFVFKSEKELTKFKLKVVEVASAMGVYIHFSP